MKKVLVLTLVLGIASLASAGFDLVQTSPTTADLIGFNNTVGGGVFIGIVGGSIEITDVSGLDTVFISDITTDAGGTANVSDVTVTSGCPLCGSSEYE